jgi:cytochrome subunit of sulfide dehydrogenase
MGALSRKDLVRVAIVVAFADALLFFLSLAHAQAPQAPAEAARGRSLVATCAACHGTEGRSVTDEVPAIARMPRDTLAARMKEFRDGKRPATVMHQLAKGYTDSQIEQIAAYLSSVPAKKGAP